MHKKVNVSIKKRKNRKYLQARYRTSSGEWIERSTQTTNRKEATAIGYKWAKAEMKEFSSKQSKKTELVDNHDTLTIGGVGAYFLISSH